MTKLKRRAFLKRAAAVPVLTAVPGLGATPAPSPREAALRTKKQEPAKGKETAPRRIPNEYSLFLPGEREALRDSPRVEAFEQNAVRARHGSEAKAMRVGDSIGGWKLLALIPWLNGVATAVFEKHVTHQGAISCARGRSSRRRRAVARKNSRRTEFGDEGGGDHAFHAI